MKEKDFCVYCYISPSGKRYIGISKNPVKRWNNGKGYIKNYHFYRAILKYGWDNFKHVVLKNGLTSEEAKTLERDLIKKYDSTNREKGYNLREGGDGSFSDYSLKLMSESRKGNNNCVGRVCSPETKQKISESLKEYYSEHNGTFSGRHHSKKTIQKLKDRFISAETLARMSKNHADVKGVKNPAARQVEQYTTDGKYIRRYEYIKQAAIANNIDASSISKCCRGKKKTSGGYIWKYADCGKAV